LSYPYKRADSAQKIFNNTGLSYLDYKKLADVSSFVPSFEGSRGCGAGCEFCAEANVRLTRLKPPAVLCSELSRYFADVPNGVRRFYLEASNFAPRLDWIQSFYLERLKSGLDDVAWRTEARVDTFSQRSIEALAQSGLKILDLGLESASPNQLIQMRKTKNPAQYLERCSRLIRTAADNGILAKLNIMLYPGETEDTIAETIEWLENNRPFFSGVSIYPAVYYGIRPSMDTLLESYKSMGASLSNVSPTEGVHHINLSNAIPYPESEFIANALSKQFMTDAQYFVLKSFSYFEPTYSEDQFKSDIQQSDFEDLPFNITEWGLGVMATQ
jgi:radical SAM superfamily enzyme YgiQ (UPF0313 family)